MAKQAVRDSINAHIKQNGTGAITGNILNGILNAMVDDYGEQSILEQKVDKITGKGLSTNDYTNVDKEKLAGLPTEENLSSLLAGKVDKITGKGLSTNDFTNAEKTKLSGLENYDDTALKNRVGEIESKEAEWDAKQDDISDIIPAQASEENPLADKAFVNSSVQTAAANFRGNWATKSAIPTNVNLYPADYTGSKTPTTNDYLVVQADETQDGGTWRYKYSGVWAVDGVNGWYAEYEVNETPLTAAQLAALNSGITADAVQQIGNNTTAIAGKYSKPSSGIPETDLSSGVQSSLSKANSALQDAPIDGKQYVRKDGDWVENEGGDLSEYAKKDGYYQQMGVGVADNLAGKGDGVPAVFTRRTTGGSASVADGVATLKSIKGKTIVWNQLVQNVIARSNKGISLTFGDRNGRIILNGTATDSGNVLLDPFSNRLVPSNHYALIRSRHIAGTCNIADSNAVFNDGYGQFATPVSGGTYIVVPRTSSTLSTPFYGISNISTGDTFDNYEMEFQMYDLTQMFGAGNEPSTVEEFEALFPADYYPYNAGQLLSFNGTGIVTDGFNQLVEPPVNLVGGSFPAFSRERYTRVFGGMQYCLRHDALGVTNWRKCYKVYDLDGNLITSDLFSQATIGVYYATVGYFVENTNNVNTQTLITFKKDCYIYIGFFSGAVTAATIMNNACLNLSHSGYRNGEYEPYWKETKQLPSLSAFDVQYTGADGETHTEGGLKSAGAAFDEVTNTKQVRRIGVVDLGTLSWYFDCQSRFNASIPNCIKGTSSVVSNIKCIPYDTVRYADLDNKKIILGDGISIAYIKDSSYTDAASFKAAMAGVLLYYELATPVETTFAEPLNLNYKVSDFGMEALNPEGVDASGVPKTAPFNGSIAYGVNAVDTIRNLPKDYISKASMDAILTALKTAGVITNYTLTYDATTGKYNCTITK